MIHKNILFNSLIIGMLLSLSACYDSLNTGYEVTTGTGCEACHTDYDMLKAVYSPDTVAPAGGCGGEAPHYEPYDRVYMGGNGFESYKQSGHYAIGCVTCHNGTDNTDDKALAHTGDFIAHPSSRADEKCAPCHESIVENFKTSIHNGTGQKRKVTIRSGLNGAEDFDKLPAHQIEGYTANCATCHGTCGNCHVVRPPIAGGGLVSGHNFNKTPDMVNICVSCHVSRGGHAYLGVATGTKPDVHLTDNGFTCLDCHSGGEMHGNGIPVDQRYAYSRLPKCENCHTGIETANNYHSMHYDDFNCQVCHSQDYNNCGSCHVHGEGARIPSYLGFKIAGNPIPDVKKDFNMTLVRRTLSAPDTWSNYGVDEYANFAAFPTYNYTSPHNLLRWTSRTTVTEGQSCSINCHVRNEGGVLINKELYLFKDDLLDWEIEATESITVDDKLPGGWLN
jgi:thiosulfate/3-mercaptopyruvate sulfurtransferase